MKTGQGNNKRWLPETFYISLLGLYGMIRRAAFKDTVLYKEHNPCYELNSFLFEAGICFNMFSEYGIGKKLEPLLGEIFLNVKIDPSNYDTNLFYREIVRLAKEICPIIREADSNKESLWAYRYAISSLNREDEFSQERLERLSPLLLEDHSDKKQVISEEEALNTLFYNNDVDEDYLELLDDDNDDVNHIEIELCFCKFCTAFREHYIQRDRHIEYIIYDALLEIDRKVNS